MMCGPMWPFLLMYGSHDMRHTGFSRVDGGQRDPGFWSVTHPLIQKASHILQAIDCNSALAYVNPRVLVVK